MNWNKVKLGDVCEIERNGINADQIESGTIYVGLENIERNGEFSEVGSVEAGELASNKFHFGPSHLLYGKLRPYLSKIARPSFEGVCSTDILPVLPGEKVDRSFLFYYLRLPEQIEQATRLSTGANLPRLSPKALAEFEIPLPPLAEQQRLAAILDGADALRALRRDGVAALDELAQSLFLELFGDPAINPKNWEMVKLGDTTEVIGGYAFPSESFAEEGTGIVRISNIQNGRLALDGMARVPESEIGSGRNYRVKPNTILIAMSGATTGKIAVTPNDPKLDLLLNQRVGMFVLDDSQITLEYLQLVLVSSFYQRFVRDQAGGAAQPNISATKLESAQIPLPPLALQQEFARQIGQLETLKARARAQAVELDALFAALSARAFAGELS